MTVKSQRQLPHWCHSDKHQTFQLTICAAANLSDLLQVLRDEFNEYQFGEPELLTPRVCEMVFGGKPVEAWDLLQKLQIRLDQADICIQPLTDLGKRLLICDMDMTIVAAETLDEVAAQLGMGDRVAAITERAMNGEMDLTDALRERIKLLAGQSAQVFRQLVPVLRFSPGAESLLRNAKAAGVHCILISSGFSLVVEPIGARLGFDEVFCNHLQLDHGDLTGELQGPIVNADYKHQMLLQRAQALDIALQECCAIGDGANDLPMLLAAGLGIAYRAKPVLRDVASCRIDVTDLSSALHFMGVAQHSTDGSIRC